MDHSNDLHDYVLYCARNFLIINVVGYLFSALLSRDSDQFLTSDHVLYAQTKEAILCIQNRLVLLIGLSFLAFWTGQARSAPDPSLVPVDGTLQLAPGSMEGRDDLLLKIDRLSAEDMQAVLGEVADVSENGLMPVKVVFERVAEISSARGQDTWAWLLTAKLSGLPPEGITLKRYLSFSLGQRKLMLDYTVTNIQTKPFGWSFKPPKRQPVGPRYAIPIGVAVGAVPATRVSLLQADIREISREYRLQVQLCLTKDGHCTGEPFPLDANSHTEIWLRPSDGGLLPGRYAGTVTIGASEKVGGDTFEVGVNSSSLCSRFLGFSAIAAGVLISFLVGVIIPNRFNREQALLPALTIRDELDRLDRRAVEFFKRVEAKPTPSAIRASIKKLYDDLDIKQLDRRSFLPTVLTNPLGNSVAAKVEDYKKFLLDTETHLASLHFLVEHGVRKALTQLTAAATSGEQDAIRKSLKKLDELADKTNITVDTLRPQIETVLTDLGTDLGMARNGGATPSNIVAPAQIHTHITYEQVAASVIWLNVGSWLAVASLSALVGWYALVWNNLGFGLPGDYVECVLWGFGLPTVGQQLVTLTPATLRTSLISQVPRS